MAQMEKGIRSGKIETDEIDGQGSEARYATLYKLALDSAEKSDEERLTREAKGDEEEGESLLGVYVIVAVAIVVIGIVLVTVTCLYFKRKNEK